MNMAHVQGWTFMAATCRRVLSNCVYGALHNAEPGSKAGLQVAIVWLFSMLRGVYVLPWLVCLRPTPTSWGVCKS
jgi:hypothetical protein